MRPERGAALLLFFGAASPACGDEGGIEPSASVVIGVTSDLAIGFDLERVVVTMRIDDEVVRTEDLRYSDGRLTLPEEFWFDRVPVESTVDVEFEAYARDAEAPLVRQRGATTATAGRTPLLLLGLDEACADVSCDAGSSCQGGVCVEIARDPATLDEHDSSWIDDAPDACREPGDEPTLEIGLGQLAFAPVQDGATLTLEAGPQGGYHVWLALRVDGLRQQGSLVEVKGTLTDLGRHVPTFVSTITLHRAEEQCELYGLRYRVDDDLLVEELLSQPLTIELTVSDATGASVTSIRSVVLSDTFIPLP